MSFEGNRARNGNQNFSFHFRMSWFYYQKISSFAVKKWKPLKSVRISIHAVTTVVQHDRDELQVCGKVKCDSPAPCARGTCYLYHPFIPWHQNSYSPHCSLCISCDWQGEFVYWSRVFYRARLIEAFWEFFSSQKFISIPSRLTIVRIQSPCWTQFRPTGTQRFSKSRVFFENREAPGYKILIHERQRMHVWKSRGLWLIILWRFVFHLRRSDEFCFFLIIIS